MTNTLLSRSLILMLFVMPFMAPIWVIEDPLFANHAHLKMTLGLIGSLTIMLLWMFKRERGYTFQVRYTKLLFIFLGFIAWEFVTLFWVQNMYLASIALIQHSSFVVIFFLAINLLSKKDMPIVLNILVISLVLVSIIGLMQYYFNDIDFIKNLFYQKIAPAATFINKNMASHFMVMVLPISLVLFLFANKRLYAVLYSIAFYLGTWYVLYIQARQAYLALMIEFLVLAIFLGLDFWKNNLHSEIYNLYFRKTKLLLALTILILLSVAGNFTNQGWNADDNVKLKRLSAISIEGGNSRIPLWINTIEMIKDHPLIGVGVDQWSEHYPLYYDKTIKDVAFNEKTRLQRVHNEYIETLASVGLIGYAFLLWMLFYIVRYIVVALSNANNKDRSIVLSSTLGIVGFAVVAFFSFPIQSYLPAFMLMFFVAIVAQLNNPPTDSVLKIKDKYYLSSFVVAALLLYSGNFVYKLLSAEHYYQKSLESYNMDYFDSGLEYSNVARKLSPNVWKHNQMNAVFLMKKNRFEEAIELLKKANFISPYNIFSFFNLQESYARLGDIKQQMIVLEKILEIDPLNVKASSILVRAFYIQKKYKEATIEYKRTKKNFEYFKGRSGFGPYHANLAETALLVGDYKYFGHIYDDLIAQDSTAENYVVYGIVEYQRTGNKTKAKELFNKAIEIDQTIDIPKEIRSDLGL
jgi:O-antigen ligase